MKIEDRIQNVSSKSSPAIPIIGKFRNPSLADGSPRGAPLSAKPREAMRSSCLAGGSSRRARRAQFLPRHGLVKTGKVGAIRNCIRVLLILCMVSLAGCGYQMVGKETHVPPGLSSIAIPTFKNQTFEPGIEILFTQAFLNEFIQDRRVKVVSRTEADSILEGVVKYFTISAVAYDSSGFVSQYQFYVLSDFTLKDRSGKVLWVEKDVRETQWFRAPSVGVTRQQKGAEESRGTSGVTYEAAKQAAIQKTAAFMAERIRNRFFYNF